MDSQNPPSKIARLAHNSGDCEKMNSNGPPQIELNLELGCGSGHRQSGTKCFRFTYIQLQELQHQALIYRYMEAGLPVPYHLVYPIWKSVATSSVTGLNGHQHYPSLLGHGAVNLEYRKGLDPEPGRCRRTDGKKWRCSKEAVQDHKYCERHMHRGRQRSTNSPGDSN